MRHLFVATLAATVTTAAIASFAACSSDSTSSPDDTTDASTDRGLGPGEIADSSGTPPPPPSSGDGSAGKTTCQLEREYFTGCKLDLTCSDTKFDAWCKSNDTAINSVTYRNGEASCLTQANCDPDKRKDCEYRTYNTATATPAEQALVGSYCQTCEPGDTLGCVARSTKYNVGGGPNAVPDIFVAAWELADPIVLEIQNKCTGSALDGGVDAGGDGGAPDGGAASCAKAFAGCAADVYLAHLPDCP